MNRTLNDKLVILYNNLDRINQKFRERVIEANDIGNLTVDIISDLVEQRNTLLKIIGKVKAEADNNFYRFINVKMNSEASPTIYKIIKSLLELKNSTNTSEKLVIIDDLLCLNESKAKEARTLLEILKLEEERLKEAKETKKEVEPERETSSVKVVKEIEPEIETSSVKATSADSKEDLDLKAKEALLKTIFEPIPKQKINPLKFLERKSKNLEAIIPYVKAKINAKAPEIKERIITYTSIIKENSYKALNKFLSLTKKAALKTKIFLLASKNNCQKSFKNFIKNSKEDYNNLKDLILDRVFIENTGKQRMEFALSSLILTSLIAGNINMAKVNADNLSYLLANGSASYLETNHNLDDLVNKDLEEPDIIKETRIAEEVQPKKVEEPVEETTEETEPEEVVAVVEETVEETKEETETEEVVEVVEEAEEETKEETEPEKVEETEEEIVEETKPEEVVEVAVAKAEPEVIANNLKAEINPAAALADNSSKPGLIPFNPNNFYRCPDYVPTETLTSILGLSNDQFEVVYGIVCSESGANFNGYNEVYCVFYTLLNRISAANWINSHGSSLYTQAVAPNQYVVYQDGLYRNYLRYSSEQRGEALMAMRDAMYNYIVNYENRPHSFTSFRSNHCVNFSSKMFTPGGNRYDSIMKSVIRPAFLDSDAAVALRNQALGYTEAPLSR